jgi:hypothetical protein
VERLLLALIIGGVAVAVAAVIKRREPDAPTGGSGHIPMQVDRRDFARPELPFALLVFTSATCASCADVWNQARALAGDRLSVEKIEVAERIDLHDRYRIDAVPVAVLADHDGVVRRWFLGPTADGEIADTIDPLINST